MKLALDCFPVSSVKPNKYVSCPLRRTLLVSLTEPPAADIFVSVTERADRSNVGYETFAKT
jgi:hypothetical protein